MAFLFGKNYTREQLLQYVGDISQIAGVRLGELADGFERGVRTAEFRTGSGLEFTILLDRGMDIAQGSFNGISLAWRSATTAAAPGFFEPQGFGWFRGFHAGLLTTCGLTYFGSPNQDDGKDLGLHGRASNIPATHITYGGEWQGNDYVMWVSGQIREATVFGENLTLTRRISARLGESSYTIEDTVVNEGYTDTPHMQLYHINFGFPVLSEDSELLIATESVLPHNPAAAEDLQNHQSFLKPTQDFQEQVFSIIPRADADGLVNVALVNRKFDGGRGIGCYVRFNINELPRLVEWKMMGQGTYVCGIEPATNWVGGRDVERKEGRLTFLKPGEKRRYLLEVGVLESNVEIDAFVSKVN